MSHQQQQSPTRWACPLSKITLRRDLADQESQQIINGPIQTMFVVKLWIRFASEF